MDGLIGQNTKEMLHFPDYTLGLKPEHPSIIKSLPSLNHSSGQKSQSPVTSLQLQQYTKAQHLENSSPFNHPALPDHPPVSVSWSSPPLLDSSNHFISHTALNLKSLTNFPLKSSYSQFLHKICHYPPSCASGLLISQQIKYKLHLKNPSII